MEPPSLPPPSPSLQVERAVAPISFPDVALERVLRNHLFPRGSTRETCRRWGVVRYVYNRVDLDGDRTPETLAALLGPRVCGREGCPVLLARHFGARMTPLQTLTGFHSFLLVSQERSRGWRDLILPQPSAPPGGPAPVLSHDGAGYTRPPSNDRAEDSPARGISALALRSRPYLVQGHPLACLPGTPEVGRINETRY